MIKISQPKIYDQNNIALILFTSGSTAHPKAVSLSHENIFSNLQMIDHLYTNNIDMYDRSYSVLPWYHCYGLVCELLYLSSKGGQIIPALNIKNILSEMRKTQPTLLFTVPKMIEKIYKSPIQNVPTYYLRNKLIWGNDLRMISVGGSSCPIEYLNFIKNTFNIDIFQGYGLTETSPMISLNSPKENKIGSVGKPLKKVQIKFSDQNEILIKSPSLMKGYINNIDKNFDISLLLDQKGWYPTGDKGYMDKNGYLFINGRLKNEYKLLNGKYIMPTFIENIIISQIKEIEQALLIPSQNYDKNILLIYSNNIDKQLNNKIYKILSEKIDKYELPSQIHFLQEPFSLENNQLSLKMEIKRQYVIELFYKKKLKIYNN
jgi:long-chain acyl-CoA synthetase